MDLGRRKLPFPKYLLNPAQSRTREVGNFKGQQTESTSFRVEIRPCSDPYPKILNIGLRQTWSWSSLSGFQPRLKADNWCLWYSKLQKGKGMVERVSDRWWSWRRKRQNFKSTLLWGPFVLEKHNYPIHVFNKHFWISENTIYELGTLL